MTELAHHGVKGMRWGVRRSVSGSTTLSSMAKVHEKRSAKAQQATSKSKHSHDSKEFHKIQEKVKTHSVHSLTNEELKKLNSRLNLEQQYSKMVTEHSKSNRSKTRKVTSALLSDLGKVAVNQVKQEVGRQVVGVVIKQVKS